MVLLTFLSCGRRAYISPEPHFDWPEMHSSLISGKLGIHIPEDILSKAYKPSETTDCCKHKAIDLGKGLLRFSEQSANSVFSEVRILEAKPNDTYIKSLELRGLLNFKDAGMVVEFMPYVEPEYGADNIYQYNIRLSLNIELTSIDFMLNDIRGFSINIENESTQPIPRHRINAALQNLVDELFELAADHLAKQIINMYGART